MSSLTKTHDWCTQNFTVNSEGHSIKCEHWRGHRSIMWLEPNICHSYYSRILSCESHQDVQVSQQEQFSNSLMHSVSGWSLLVRRQTFKSADGQSGTDRKVGYVCVMYLGYLVQWPLLLGRVTTVNHIGEYEIWVCNSCECQGTWYVGTNGSQGHTYQVTLWDTVASAIKTKTHFCLFGFK